MSGWIDVNVWTGQFPFRRIAGTTLEEIEQRFSPKGFGSAIVSPMEAIFQEDSYEAEAELASEIAKRCDAAMSFRHVKVVNPACSWWERDLRRAVDELAVCGFRLCPTFHRYRLEDPEMASVMAVAGELGLSVQIMCKMQDWRIEWMFHTEDVEIDQVGPFLERFRDHPVILSGLHFHDMTRLAKTIEQCPRLLLDTSRLKGPWNTFGKLGESVSASKLCFGSLWPINLPECPLMQLAHGGLTEETSESVLRENAAAFYGV